MLTRRYFLRGSAMAMAGAGAVPFWLGRAAATTQARRKILVAIFQRGAADGLNMVVPFAEKRYYELRPTIGIPAPKGGNGGAAAIDLDGRFGLNPALQPLKALWDKNMLAIVEATGSPDPTRSHFDAQDYMESGTPGLKGDGWLNRALPAAGAETSPLRAIAMSASLPRTLRGDHSAIAVRDLQQFRAGDETSSILESMYSNSADRQLGTAGKDAFAAMRMIQSLNKTPYTPSSGAQYPQGGELGRALQQIARLIKADAGVEAAFAEIGGWDHHQNEPGQLGNVARQFGSALAAFCNDMGDRMEDIVLVTMSEFGRTAQENGNNGTDHGHGDVMFVMGGAVRGGKVYGKWPGLEKEQLYEGRDLAVTTDFRAVLGELMMGHFGTKDLAPVFPGFRMGEPMGLLKSTAVSI
uniref:Twin-arginine translocation pathway signal n=1 Tax=Solibacter usitatus (strain Ellin6076) TaxID=234267 RepID=Q01XH5_SOLUE